MITISNVLRELSRTSSLYLVMLSIENLLVTTLLRKNRIGLKTKDFPTLPTSQGESKFSEGQYNLWPTQEKLNKLVSIFNFISSYEVYNTLTLHGQ